MPCPGPREGTSTVTEHEIVAARDHVSTNAPAGSRGVARKRTSQSRPNATSRDTTTPPHDTSEAVLLGPQRRWVELRDRARSAGLPRRVNRSHCPGIASRGSKLEGGRSPSTILLSARRGGCDSARRARGEADATLFVASIRIRVRVAGSGRDPHALEHTTLDAMPRAARGDEHGHRARDCRRSRSRLHECPRQDRGELRANEPRSRVRTRQAETRPHLPTTRARPSSSDPSGDGSSCGTEPARRACHGA
jgi:hypothetical protein